MQASRLVIAAAALATAAFGAMADQYDGSEHALQFQGSKTRAEVQAELQAYQKAGVNPWSISYNQLAGFRSGKSRSQVQGEYLANREAAQALLGEDSGSAYLAQHQNAFPADRMLASQPAAAGSAE